MPLLIEATEGRVTTYLEVMMSDGKLILNSKNANYSYDSLHRIFKDLFHEIGLQNYSFKNILILGMGGGSVISLIRDVYKIPTPITAVEKDPVVINLARKYFNIEKFEHLTIVEDDAFDFVQETTDKFDLIISDLFIDAEVPRKFSSLGYLNNIRKISSKSSCVIYNKITEYKNHKEEMKLFSKNFTRCFPNSVSHKIIANNVENTLLCYNTLPLKSEIKTDEEQLINN